MNAPLALLLAALASSSPAAPQTEVDPFLDFALRVEASINALDPALLDDALDHETFMARVRGDARVPEELHRAFSRGLRENLHLGTEVCAAIERGGSYTLLGVEPEGALRRARFRMLSDGALNYHELLLAPPADRGDVRVIDCFVYLTGEELSESVRRNYLQVASVQDRGLLAGLFGGQPSFVRHMDELVGMQEALQSGDYRRALAIHDRLPEDLRREKNVFLMRIQAAQNLEGDDDLYLEALQEFRAQFPDEPHLDLILLDAYFLEGDLDAVLGCIERLEQRLGDPYLECLRANAHFERGEGDEALAAVGRALEKEPTLEDAAWLRLGMAVELGRFDVAVQALSRLEDDFGYAFDELESEPGFAALVASPEYAAWLAERR